MKILVSGSSGFVGTALVERLRQDGHRVARLIRPATSLQRSAGDVSWDPVAGELDAAAAEGTDAVVHLAGASIGEGRWSEQRKRVLRASRVDATRHLVGALAGLSRPPQAFLSASAIGYYGDRGDEELTEESPPGNDFLAGMSRDWEAEARAAQFAARTATLRFGLILSPRGGALPRLLTPFRLGLGGRLGSGKQWMSWLTLDEAVGILRYALANAEMRGAINAVAPQPVRNAEFTAILARVLRRPAIFPVPASALRLLLGEMADALLLQGQRVLPAKLLQSGYRFQQPELEPALTALLRRAA